MRLVFLKPYSHKTLSKDLPIWCHTILYVTWLNIYIFRNSFNKSLVINTISALDKTRRTGGGIVDLPTKSVFLKISQKIRKNILLLSINFKNFIIIKSLIFEKSSKPVWQTYRTFASSLHVCLFFTKIFTAVKETH